MEFVVLMNRNKKILLSHRNQSSDSGITWRLFQIVKQDNINFKEFNM